MELSTVICLLTILICKVMCNISENILEQKNNKLYSENETGYINSHFNWRWLDKENCGSSMSDRIIGGTNAELGQYPWLARLGYTDTEDRIIYHSGGTLISECWVISAAHCVEKLPNALFLSTIRLGEYNVGEQIDCVDSVCADSTQDFIPLKVLIHKDFGNPRLKHDISLIKLHTRAKLTRWVQPICLPYGDLLKKDFLGNRAEVAGWGVEDLKSYHKSKILQTISLPVIDNSRCSKSFRSVHIDYHQICVGGVRGFDSCGGDSGGPLMKVDVITSPKYYIIGIVSYGSKRCGEKPIPAVYTRITTYIGWILDNISSCDCY